MGVSRLNIVIASFLFLLSACVPIGPQITSEEEKRTRETLITESKTWQKKQQERIDQIASRLLAAAGTKSVLRFVFIGNRDQTGGQINPEVVHAWTDGEGIWITRGMVRFLKSDDEMASVLSHEMAHALRGHMTYLWAQQILGQAVVIPAGRFGGQASAQVANWLVQAATRKFDRDREREADLYGLIWAHRAGFNVDVARELFRRMAVEMPESVDRGFLSTHPSLSERFLAMDKIAAALKAGQDPLKVFGPKEEAGEKKVQREKKDEEKIGGEDGAK